MPEREPESKYFAGLRLRNRAMPKVQWRPIDYRTRSKVAVTSDGWANAGYVHARVGKNAWVETPVGLPKSPEAVNGSKTRQSDAKW